MKNPFKAIREAHNKLFRKKTHGTIWGQKFDGTVVSLKRPQNDKPRAFRIGSSWFVWMR